MAMESLTVSFAHQIIDEVISGDTREIQELGFTLKRASTLEDWNSMLKLVSNQSNLRAHPSIPFYFGIGILHEGNICGIMTVYMAYSTWDGRDFFVDRLEMQGGPDVSEKLLLATLAKVAVKLGCARLTWRHTETPSWYLSGTNPPDILRGWLTLCMDKPAMEKYVAVSESTVDNAKSAAEPVSRTLVEQAVLSCLTGVNKEVQDSKFRLRLAGSDDIETIARLVQGLAVYEKEPDAVNLTIEDYRRDGGSQEPLFFCLMLDFTDDNKQVHTCGMVFFYFGYILGKGRFLYLEDLFLEVSYRKNGGGTLAMQSLARLSLALQCTQFYWVALDWNTPALNLYAKIGAKIQEGVLTTRYSGEGLQMCASGS